MFKSLSKPARSPQVPSYNGMPGSRTPSPREMSEGLLACFGNSFSSVIALGSNLFRRRSSSGIFPERESSRLSCQKGMQMKNKRLFNPFVLLALLALFFIAASTVAMDVAPQPPAELQLNAECVEFVETRKQNLAGAALKVHSCDHKIRARHGGYCVCSGSKAVQAVAHFLRFQKLTCQNLCKTAPAASGVSIPSSTSCPTGTPYFFQDPHLNFEGSKSDPLSQSVVPAVAWWTALQKTLEPSDMVVLPPGPRNQTHDFVARGFTFQPKHIEHIHEQWATFSETAKRLGRPESMDDILAAAHKEQPCDKQLSIVSSLTAFEAAESSHAKHCKDSESHGHETGSAGKSVVETFSGEGVVILSGAAPYFVPSLVALKSLRHVGCSLPVELWIPDSEAPSPKEQKELQQELVGLGAQLKILPVSSGWHPQGGYYLKAVVLAVSSFQKVLFMDADNVAISDPTHLFQSPEFRETGAVMWHDYWDASWAPDAPAILGVKPDQLPQYTHDSGQMLFDKSRVWPALVSALFFNIHSFLFAPLFTNFMGMGDKETFPFALIAHDYPYTTIKHHTYTVGLQKRVCSFRGIGGCWDEVFTNTMAQKGLDGKLMFMHTNMPPKWTLAVPEDFKRVVRRWQAITPGEHDRIESFVQRSQDEFGRDMEKDVHGFLIQARCSALVLNLTRAQEEAAGDRIGWNAAHIANERLPSNPREMRLSQLYEDPGLTGDFLTNLNVRWTQRIQRWWNSWRFGRPRRWAHSTSILVERKDVAAMRGHW